MFKVKKLNHIGIIVDNLEQGVELYKNILGLDRCEIKELQGEAKFALFVLENGTQIELIEPNPNWEPPSKEWADSLKSGLHHLCFEVEDINQALSCLEGKGVKSLDSESRAGATGSIAFLSPSSTMGVMLELVQKD